METLKNYTGTDPAIKAAFDALEDFIGDMENAELADGSTVYAADVVEAVNILIDRLSQH